MAGKKTCTRRIAKSEKPPFAVGDILYVRETWCINTFGTHYRADWPNGACPEMDGDDRWHPSIHMGKDIARIFLRVKSVERGPLRGMEVADFQKEGVMPQNRPGGCKCAWAQEGCTERPCKNRNAYEWWRYMTSFRKLWDSTLPMIEGKKFKTSLSVPTIYKYIAKGLFLNLTQEELPRHGKKKHKYKKVKKNKSASRAPAGESIEQRPEEIDEREEFGHWEGDTVYSGKGKRKTTRALLTLTERKTRKEIIIAIPNRKAETVVKALDALERKLGARRFRAIFKSITFDNGTEFAAAEELERSCINKHLPRTKVYFCHPYSSWERGTNENTNGMIRRRFPKGTNFAAVTNAQITQAENWINNYPRKILGYKSSEIVFRECLRELGIAA